MSYSKYHHAAFGETANHFTGAINKEYNKVEYYFQLKKTNDSLVKANEWLYNKLRTNYNLPDSSNKIVTDSIRIDSLVKYRKFNYLSAKVVSNSIASQSNYIVLYGPNVHLFKQGMGVVGINNNVVGVIMDISGDYATAMSLLHKDSRISGKLSKTGETGTISWNGEQTNIVTLSNVSKSAKLTKGDSVITSGFSAIFPKGLLIGRVESAHSEKSNNNFRIDVRTATDFNNIEYVYGIESADAEPVKKLLDKAKASAN